MFLRMGQPRHQPIRQLAHPLAAVQAGQLMGPFIAKVRTATEHEQEHERELVMQRLASGGNIAHIDPVTGRIRCGCGWRSRSSINDTPADVLITEYDRH